MKRRRITALALSAMMVGTMLAGCGTKSEAPAGGESAVQTEAGEKKETTGGAASGEKTTLSMMVFPSTENYETINAKFLEQNPDLAEKVDFEVQLGGSGDGDVADKLRLALTSGENVPDIVRLNYTQLPEFAKAGVLYPLDDYIAEYEDRIIDAAKSIMKYDDTYYALPREVKPKVWFYRADIFEECEIGRAHV